MNIEHQKFSAQNRKARHDFFILATHEAESRLRDRG